MTTELALVLLFVLPLMYFTKGTIFAVLTSILYRQHSQGNLGVWLTRLFGSLVFTSLVSWVMFSVFAWRWHDVDLSSWLLLMAPIAGGLGWTIWCGANVVRWHREEVIESDPCAECERRSR